MKLQILRNLGDGYPPLKEGDVAEVEDSVGERILAAKRPLAIRVDEPQPQPVVEAVAPEPELKAIPPEAAVKAEPEKPATFAAPLAPFKNKLKR